MVALKQCPFCGGEAEILNICGSFIEKELFFVSCVNCEAETKDAKTEEEAILYWNNRLGD